jgi:hypothetical protein
MEKKGRRAQFYIIAAAIISVLLVGLAATVNYAITSSTPTRFYDLGEMYGLEGPKIVDQGVYQGTPEKITAALSNFSDIFYRNVRSKDPNIQIVTVFGNASSISPINYGKEDINITPLGGTTTTISASEVKAAVNLQITPSGQFSGKENTLPSTGFIGDILNPGTKVNVKVGDLNYNVTLGNQQYFYFIIMSKKPTGEVNVITAEK